MVYQVNNVRACPVCESNTIEHLFRNQFVSIGGFEMSYVLGRCDICCFHFACELPSKENYSQYYRELSKYDSQFCISQVDSQRIESAVKLFFRLGIPKKAKIVDVGCGFGAMLASLRNNGYDNLFGIDPAPKSSEKAFEQFGLNEIHTGTLSNIEKSINLQDADVVCLMAVLEHLPDLRHDLKNLLDKLKPGTLMLFEVPALDLFDGVKGEPYGELSIEHIQFFSLVSMKNLLTSLGMNIIETELVQIPSLNSGSIFMFAKIEGCCKPHKTEIKSLMNEYLSNCKKKWSKALSNLPNQPFLIYGSGSHSARLLADLNEKQKKNLITVVDGNVNLQGKKIGCWTVNPPNEISKYPKLPILISSYRSQQSISIEIKKNFPKQKLRFMYE